MLPNTIALSSTLPRVKNKTYDEDIENITYSKSVDFQNDRKSWPLSQVVECVTLETRSHISPTVSEIDISILNPISSLNVYQTNDLKSDCIKESNLNNPTNNILKIVLPLVSENVPVKCQLNTNKCDQLFSNENCVLLSNNHVKYSPEQCSNITSFSKNVNNRNNSLPEDGELNRFSSTFENIKSLLKEGLVDGLDEKPPDFQPPNPPLLYRVSSLPNLLSHDSTKSHNLCSYLTMCGTKQDFILNKLCKNIVPKHDMSVQVSTELFKNQNEKIFVDTSCQTEDIFIETQINNIMLTKDTNHNVDHASININNKQEIKINEENVIKNNINDNLANGYTNINISKTECGIKTNEEDCTSLDYTNVEILNKDYVVIANEEDCPSVGYININSFDKETVNCNGKNSISNVSYTNITTFSKECENKSNNENIVHDFKHINDTVDNINEVNGNKEYFLNIGYNNIDAFEKKLNDENKGEDCVDIGYTNFSLYDKGIEIESNDDCENYANANILEEFVNEQLSLNNIDGDFDSFLFGPLPPSPIEEIESELPVLNGVETKRENSVPAPFVFNIHKNEPSSSIIKSRSIDAEFSHNFQQHQKIGTRSVQSERRTYPSEVPVSDVYPKSSKLKTSIHPSTIEKLSDISNSLPDTPLLGRCDFPRQFSATGTKTMSQMSNSLIINMRGAGHGSSIGLGQAMAGTELLHLNGPGRGWYPRQRQFRPVSVEQLDKLASKSPVGHSQWDSREGHKPVTLPPNLTPKFFHRSPREALRRVTSLLIKKGNTNKSNKSRTVFSSSVIGPHGDISEECVSSQSKRSFFKSLWRK